MRAFSRKTAFVGMLLAMTSSNTLAQGIPVIDASSIAQLVSSLNNQATQIANQVSQITELQSQLQNMEQRLTAITGAKGISSILNNPTDQLKRQAATSLNSILQSATSGSAISGANTSRLSSTIEQLKTKFDFGNIGDFNSSDIPQDRAIATLGGSGLAAIATAEDSYARSNEGTTRVNTLIEQIDATPDLKSSIDLNTRVLAEVSQQLNEMIRLQSAVANTQGTLALSQARDRAASRKFQKIGN